jgi:hypothetical protein
LSGWHFFTQIIPAREIKAENFQKYVEKEFAATTNEVDEVETIDVQIDSQEQAWSPCGVRSHYLSFGMDIALQAGSSEVADGTIVVDDFTFKVARRSC